MSRGAKIAGVMALAGMMMAVAIVAATGERRSPAIEAPASPRSGRDPLAAELARCRTLTMPDAGCEAAWEAHRRRFFGEDEQPSADPVSKQTAPITDQGAQTESGSGHE